MKTGYVGLGKNIKWITIATIAVSVIVGLIPYFLPGKDYGAMGQLAAVIPSFSGVLLASIALYQYVKMEDPYYKQAIEIDRIRNRLMVTYKELDRTIQVSAKFNNSNHYYDFVEHVVKPLAYAMYEEDYVAVLVAHFLDDKDRIEQEQTGLLIYVSTALREKKEDSLVSARQILNSLKFLAAISSRSEFALTETYGVITKRRILELDKHCLEDVAV